MSATNQLNKEVLIIKNSNSEGPGMLQGILDERKINYTIIDLDKGDSIPSPEKYTAIVVLGGPDSANDANEKMHSELAFIKEVIRLNIPYLGICLGLQTLVKAAGGQVVKSPLKEVGFRDPLGNYFTVELTDAGKQEMLLAGLGDSLPVFQLHGETVELSQGDINMTLLATGKFCKNQVVKVGHNAYGIQCHFELTPDMFEVWINEDTDLQKLDKEKLRNDYKATIENYTHVGQQLLTNFLKIAGI
jgi:GMP synthase-like glutamine amidotransferase